MDFIALDVETANADMASICAVGLCRFDAGRPIERLYFLVNPEDRFDPLHVGIHGITAESVAGAPNLDAVLPVMAQALAGRVVVHHTHFDRIALERGASARGHQPLACRWLDSARVARRSWPHVAQRGYGLRSLANEFGIAFAHHDAREDARAAGLILLRAITETGIDLEAWFARVDLPIDLGRASRDRGKILGVVSGPLAGETIVFTGALALPRVDASAHAAKAGCNVHPGVTKETTILVVGDQDIRSVGSSGKSAKHRKAETLVAGGATLRIIGETDFLALVGSS